MHITEIFFSVDSFLQNPFCELNPQPGKLQQYCSKLIDYHTKFQIYLQLIDQKGL